eukprot:TRINITY_DN18_c0_g1_i2.p1 TRINITY_DN18_c0_g1~~TRINITY_DN18_c0_g1_i2.p1  ORF type:complete len:1027 (-),score=405.02 TRINITY_DN18_c0_g1_i2:107-3187(-)
MMGYGAAAFAQSGGGGFGQQQTQQGGEVGNVANITVAGCTHATVGSIVRGNFTLSGANHNKPVYKKDQQVNGLDVMLYFWDERDGANFSGWWFGPKVGGDQVWAYQPLRTTQTPPRTGWKVPYDGPVDQSMSLSPKEAMAAQIPAQKPAQQSWGQQAAAQQSWGQQAGQQQQQAGGQQGWGQQQQAGGQQAWGQQAAQKGAKGGWGKDAGAGEQGWGQQAGQKGAKGGAWGQQTGEQGWGQKGAAKGGKGGAWGEQSWGEQSWGQDGGKGSWGQDGGKGGAWGQQQQQTQQQTWQQQQAAQQLKIQQQKQLEEARKKQIAEEQKRKMEEMKKKQQEEMKRKQEELKKKAEEQRAGMAIRQKIQKLRIANLAGYEQAEKELTEVMQKELVNCGSTRAVIQSEIDKVKEQAKTRLEQLKEAEKKAEEAKAERERLMKEKEDKAGELLKELDEVVVAAEAAETALKEATEALDDKLQPDQADGVFETLDETTKEANEKVQACNDFLKKNALALKVPNAELTQNYGKLTARITTCTKSKDASIRTSTVNKKKAMVRMEALKKSDKLLAVFKKYDTNKDSFLDKKEISNFAKKEYKFTLPEDAMELILKALVEPGAKGVKKEDFHRVRIHVGIAREKAQDLARKKKREKREKEIEAMKAKKQTEIDGVDKVLVEADGTVKQVEEKSGPLQMKAKDLKAAEMITAADEVETELKAAKETVEDAKKEVAGLKEDVDPDVAAWNSSQVKPLESKVSKLEQRLSRITSALSRFREGAKTKDKSEVMMFETQALTMLRHHKKVKKLTSDALVESICSGDDATEASFIGFFDGCEKAEDEKAELSKDDLARLFKKWDEDDEGTVSKEKLFSLVRVFMKVKKDTVMTNGPSIKDSESLRRLDIGEVVEVLGEPESENEVDVMRVHVKAMKDGITGWATISGNQGTIFLEKTVPQFKVVKETILTDSFKLDGGDAKENNRKLRDTTRKLKIGELVEVRQWMKKEEESGLMRMKCKALSDGAIGWATTVGNTGTVYLEAK